MIPFKMITIRAAMVKGQHSRREDGKLPTQRREKRMKKYYSQL